MFQQLLKRLARELDNVLLEQFEEAIQEPVVARFLEIVDSLPSEEALSPPRP